MSSVEVRSESLFKTLVGMHKQMNTQWKLITWSAIAINLVVIALHISSRSWEFIIPSVSFLIMFLMCSLYSMLVKSLSEYIKALEETVDIQHSALKLFKEARYGK